MKLNKIKTRYNLNLVKSISVCDSEKSSYYIYRKATPKSFLKKEENEGFYGFLDDCFSIDNIPEEYVNIDNVLYLKPRIVIDFGGNKQVVKYFNKYSEALVYHTMLVRKISGFIDLETLHITEH